MMRRIELLPESVRSCMRSGVVLFDLTRVVEELVFNSIDSGATKVIVAVGVGTNYIKVTDNGCGITRDGLVLLGERYATSKFEQLAGLNTVPESFGFRGEALSSISDVSLLEVVSKAHGMPNGYRKVIKGCKCLYLGIDDDRQDVGTTVVVRDLFYNQPVRRRHLQSSPKKVLHSVKECILRIALVHLRTFFKVVNIESGTELLSLQPSSSPLPLLTSGFGIEVSSSLHKLDVSDGELKLSGYISGPYETFSVKAFQYFYINSRYISRGPIHKLLNQLATMHSSSDLLKADISSESGKRNRCQSPPTYILNLTCPRSHYDLSFEPAKTCVEFKDWGPVYTFIKKSIPCFGSRGAPMSEDYKWTGADTLSTGDDLLNKNELSKKRRVTRSHQESIIISSPQLKIPIVEPKDIPFSSYSCNRSQRNSVQSEDFGNNLDFACLPHNSLQFSPISLPKYESPIPHESTNSRSVVKEPSAVSFHFDNNGENVADKLMKPFLRSCSSRKDVPTVAGSTRGDDPFRSQADGLKKWLYMDNGVDNEKVASLPHSSLQFSPISFPKYESPIPHEGTNSRLAVKEPSTVSFHFDNDGENVTDKLMKPFLRSCSSRKDVPTVVGSTRGDDQFRSQSDGLKTWLYMDDGIDNEKVACLPHSSLQFSPISLPKYESPIPHETTNSRLVVKEPSAVSFHFDNDGENVANKLMKPFLRSCFSCKDVPTVVGSTRGDDQFRSQADGSKKWLYMDNGVNNEKVDHVIKGSEPWLDDAPSVWSPPRLATSWNLSTDSPLLLKGSFDSIMTDGVCLPEDNSHWASPVASIKDSRSSHQSSKRDWSASKFGSAFVEKMDVGPLTDVLSKRHYKHRRDDGFDISAYEEGETDIFNFDQMRYSPSLEGCSWSSHMHSSLFLKDHESWKKKSRNSQNDSILFPQRCDFLYETEWTRSESSGRHENCIPVAASRHMSSLSHADGEKSKMAHSRFQDKQRRRSSSAPPFHRGKKKFHDLSNWMTITSGKPHHETLQNAPTLQETSHLKHIKKLLGVDRLALEEGSVSNLRSKTRHDKKKTIDEDEVSASEAEAVHCLDVSKTDSDFTLKENQDALDVGGKWRNGCPLTSGIPKLHDHFNQESILDISSGILLSGDSLLPKSISMKCLEDSKVLQQVDRKFIPIVGGGILAIIDQHAADERIRLEDLREKVLSGETKTITYLDAEQELALPEIGYQLLNNYSEQIKKWGWICNFHAQSSVSFKKNMNFLHNQPSAATLIGVPCILGVNLTDVDLLEYLEQLADTDGSSVIPPGVLRVLNSKACRGAIMFGDALLPSECSLIIEELKQTSMCFQCAHGRPTTAPLVNLVALHKQIAKLGNWSHVSSGTWHGLSRHQPSLERAAQRLSSGGGEC